MLILPWLNTSMSPPGHMDSALHPKSLPAIPDTAVCCFTCTWQKLYKKYVKDYFYTSSQLLHGYGLLPVQEAFRSAPQIFLPRDEECDLLGCYLGLAITQSWQGERLSSCKEMAEKDLPTLMLE